MKLYRFQAKRIALSLILSYENGVYQAMEITGGSLGQSIFQKLMPIIPYSDELFSKQSEILDSEKIVFFQTFDLKEDEKLAPNEKIALWRTLYQTNNAGVKYTLSKAEIGIMKKFDFSVKELITYFSIDEWWCKKGEKSITNFKKNIDKVRCNIAGISTTKASEKKQTHPDYYSKSHENSLKTPQEIQDYLAHLREKGWAKIADEYGNAKWQKL